MELSDLGFDAWFEERAREALRPEHRPARVSAVDRERYLVRHEGGEVPAELAGRLRFSVRSAMDLPCVGDWVGVQPYDGGASAVIHQLLPRKTILRRKHAGRNVDYQCIAANIDAAFVVQSCQYDFNLRRLDRYLVMASDGGIEPVLLLSKSDLVDSGERERLLAEVRRAGVTARTLALSGASGDGLEEFRQLLVPGRTYCLLGSSGVGKTTLINRLLGSEQLATKPVSGTGEGTHATARRQLVLLDQGAMLIDTPGMRELGLVGAGAGIDESFSDIAELARSCRFADCGHREEPGCAVRAAAESGALSPERYRSYLKLRKESEFHELSYVERRKRDRAFGRLIKSLSKRKNR